MITSHMAADSHGLTGSAFQAACRRRYRARGDRCAAYKNAEEQGSTREPAALFRNCSPSHASPATSRSARPERPAPAQRAAPAGRHSGPMSGSNPDAEVVSMSAGSQVLAHSPRPFAVGRRSARLLLVTPRSEPVELAAFGGVSTPLLGWFGSAVVVAQVLTTRLDKACA
jgi:hypothetical protein